VCCQILGDRAVLHPQANQTHRVVSSGPWQRQLGPPLLPISQDPNEGYDVTVFHSMPYNGLGICDLSYGLVCNETGCIRRAHAFSTCSTSGTGTTQHFTATIAERVKPSLPLNTTDELVRETGPASTTSSTESRRQ
jgi:hypothetical protein